MFLFYYGQMMHIPDSSPLASARAPEQRKACRGKKSLPGKGKPRLYRRSRRLNRRSVERETALCDRRHADKAEEKGKTMAAREENHLGKAGELAELVLKAVALAMGAGVAALAVMDEVEPRTALCLLGIGVACLALVQLSHTGEERQ